MNLQLSRDTNGNKTLKITFPNVCRGFSVQTLESLPKTHNMTNCDFNRHIAESELHYYIKNYGTKNQKQKLNIY